MLLAVVGFAAGHSMGWLHSNPETGARLSTVALFVFFSLNLLLEHSICFPCPARRQRGIMLFMSESRAQRYLDWLRGTVCNGGLLVACLSSATLRPVENFPPTCCCAVASEDSRMVQFAHSLAWMSLLRTLSSPTN